MVNFILKKVFGAMVTIFFVITCTFFLTRTAPGSPFANIKVTKSDVEMLEKEYGLDKNIFVQYYEYIKGLFLHFDFGPSFSTKGVSVNDLIFPKKTGNEETKSGFWISIKFGLIVLAVVIFFGISIGILCALKKDSIIGKIIDVFSVCGIAIPTIVTAPLLVLFFSVYLEIFSVFGWAFDFSHLFLPVLVISIPSACRLIQIQKNSLCDVMNSSFILTAKAKGLKKKDIILKHALKPSLIPSISFLGPTAADILSGSVIAEAVFNFAGIGSMASTAALGRDYSAVMGTVIIFSFILILCNTIVDILYSFISPKINIK